MKLWTYIVIMLGLELILVLAGIPIPGVNSGDNPLLERLGISTSNDVNVNPEGDLYKSIFDDNLGILMGLLGAAIVIGYITKSASENYAILPLIVGTGGLSFGLYTFYSLFHATTSYAFSLGSWEGYVTLVIMSPLSVGFLISIIEFFRGTD